MWLQEAVEGVDLWQALAGSDSQLAIDRLVESIDKLQNCSLDLEREHSLADELTHLHQRLREVAHEAPHLRSRLERLSRRCEDLSQSIPDVPSVPTHRDFYPDQVLLAGDSLCIIDWDLLCLSHPALDMGNFCGHLLERAIRDPAARDTLRKRIDDFRAHYFNAGREADWQSIEAYATLTLVRHVFLCTQFADRSKFLPNILMECERRLDLHGRECSIAAFQF